MLHFDYSVGKDNFIIDPGTFVYTGNVARRNIYRSGAMHNGPCVSGIHSPTDPFGWRQRPDCTITEQRVTESRPVVAATYSLTDINDSRINVGRRVEYTGDGIWVISDEISGNGQFTASWNFVSPHQIETLDSLFRFRGQQSELRFFPIAVAGALTTFVESSTYSDDYLAEQPASSIKAQAIGEGRIFVIWLMQVEADPESRIFSVKCEDQKRILAETNSRVLSLEIKSAMEKSDK
jgi:hypothetical protein